MDTAGSISTEISKSGNEEATQWSFKNETHEKGLVEFTFGFQILTNK